MATTVVGLFDDIQHAREAVSDLKENGFSLEDMSLVSRHSREDSTAGENADPDPLTKAATGMGEGAVLGGLAGLLMGITMLAIPGMGWVLAAGPFAVTMGGAIAGGMMGAMQHHGVPEHEASIYAEAVKRGGTLVTLHTTDELADRAADIMNLHHPVDISERVNEWTDWQEDDRPLYSPKPSSRARSYPSSRH